MSSLSLLSGLRPAVERLGQDNAWRPCWRRRLPTLEEVAAHAEAHPSYLNSHRASRQVTYGLWLRVVEGRGTSLEHLGTTDRRQQVYDSLGFPLTPTGNDIRWLPVTADGVPVGVQTREEDEP